MSETFAKPIPRVADPISLSRRYVAAGGMRCPVCNSSHISSHGKLALIGASATQGAKCDDCGSSWREIYHLHKIADLVDRRTQS